MNKFIEIMGLFAIVIILQIILKILFLSIPIISDYTRGYMIGFLSATLFRWMIYRYIL